MVEEGEISSEGVLRMIVEVGQKVKNEVLDALESILLSLNRLLNYHVFVLVDSFDIAD